MRFFGALFALSVACAGAASAQQSTQVLPRPTLCPVITDSQGFRMLTHVNAGKSCAHDHARPHAFIDGRLGIKWSTVIGETMSWVPFSIKVAPDSIDAADSRTRCLHAVDDIVKEWFVEHGKSCTQMGRPRYYRYYVRAEFACVLPSNYCFKIDDLELVGKARALDSIERAQTARTN